MIINLTFPTNYHIGHQSKQVEKKKGNSDYHEMNDDQKFDHLRS
jgi:hypothetical protein